MCTSLAQDSRRRALVCLPLGQAPAGTVGGALFSGALCPPPCSQKHPGLTPFQLSLQSNRLTKIEGLQSLVMTAEETAEGLRYLYKLKEALPPPSSHARAVVAAKGVTLEAMVAGLSRRGLDMRTGDPGWETIRRGAV